MKHVNVNRAVARYAKVEKITYDKSDIVWYRAEFCGKVISWFVPPETDSAWCVHVRGSNDHDDSQSDYYAGRYYETISGAIESFIDGLNNE